MYNPPPEEDDEEQRVKEQFVREAEKEEEGEEELDAKIERAPPHEEDEQEVNVIFSSVMFPLSASVMEIAPPPPLEHAHSSNERELSVAFVSDEMFNSITPPLPLPLVIDVKVQFCIELAVLMGTVMSGLFFSVKLVNVLFP